MQDLRIEEFDQASTPEPAGVATVKRIAYAMGRLTDAQRELLDGSDATDMDVTEAVEDAFDTVKAMLPEGTETLDHALSAEGFAALRRLIDVINSLMWVQDSISRGLRVSDRETQSRWRGAERAFQELQRIVRGAGPERAA